MVRIIDDPVEGQAGTAAIRIPIEGGMWLDADITIPADAQGVVVCADGRGTGRESPLNRYVASELNFVKLATVLVDLVRVDEERQDPRGMLQFDIPMLTRRFIQLIDWTAAHDRTAMLPMGLFGASTGAAAALDAATARPQIIGAVVSRGGRPDLASNVGAVKAPTLLIAGGNDPFGVSVNAEALRRMTCRRQMQVVPGASHLFDEPGTLEHVASAAADWFLQHLPAIRRAGPS